jgi:PilZ domain
MSVETNSDLESPSDTDRRQPDGVRVPFEGTVEVGGALGPSFDAEAVDVSEHGIHLRTSCLPELGQPLTCRLEVEKEVVLASGHVVWREEKERGGEFGLRFTDLDAASEAALQKLVAAMPASGAPSSDDSKVRLHIEGLGSPMRMKIQGSAEEGVVVGSELGFLQVGKELELEDARTGGKRPARIEKVSVEINPETQIPQLVVSLRYDVSDTDQPGKAVAAAKADDTPEPSVIGDESPVPLAHAKSIRPKRGSARDAIDASDGDDGDLFGPMRSGVGDAMHRIGNAVAPAMSELSARAKTTFAAVANRAREWREKNAASADKPRRTTAPAPAGGLHATGRKVVRSGRPSALEAVDGKLPLPLTKRRAAVLSAVAVAGVLVFAAVHKPAVKSPPVAQTEPSPTTSDVAAGAAASPGGGATTPSPVSTGGTLSPAPALAAAPPEESPTPAPPAIDDSHAHKKAIHVTPFGNGPVGHANVLRLKMDGAIEKIEGATTPTGFTVVIPDHRSLEPAGPLASRDGRIASVRVTNESSGAEFSMNFKDGVPNYLVRAKGDTLEILLAPQGKLGALPTTPKARTSGHATR